MYLLQWLKLKHTHSLTLLSADKDAEQMKSFCLLAGMKNGTATLEISLAVPLKDKLIKSYTYYMAW